MKTEQKKNSLHHHSGSYFSITRFQIFQFFSEQILNMDSINGNQKKKPMN